MHDNVDEQPGASSRSQGTPNGRLSDALQLIADRIDVLASKQDKTQADKDRDDAEQERKKAHDDRTYRRQGWAISVAAVALILNFISLIGLGLQAATARHAVEQATASATAATKSSEAAIEALELAKKSFSLNNSPSASIDFFKTEINPGKITTEIDVSNLSNQIESVYFTGTLLNGMDKEVYIGLDIIEKINNTSPTSEIFPHKSSRYHNEYKLLNSQNLKQNSEVYITDISIMSGIDGEKYIITDCIVYVWDGISLKSNGKFCVHNHRDEPLSDYLTQAREKKN